MSQLQLPFGWKHAEDRAVLVRAIRLAKVKAAGETLLLFVHDVAQGEPLRRSYEQLADRLGVHKRTAQRLVGRLIDLGLLIVETDRYRTGGQRENGYSIDWDGVRAIAFGSAPLQRERGDKMPRGGDNLPTGGGNLPTGGGNLSPPIRKRPTVDPPRNHLLQLEADLGAMGVEDLGAAREATRRGLTVTQIRQLLEHYRDHPGAWGPAALAYRIRHARPDLAPDQGWPDYSPDYARAQANADQDRRIDQQASQLARQRAEKVADDMRAASRERLYGPELDNMTQAQLDRLCDEAAAGLGEFAKYLSRADLLAAMEARS